MSEGSIRWGLSDSGLKQSEQRACLQSAMQEFTPEAVCKVAHLVVLDEENGLD